MNRKAFGTTEFATAGVLILLSLAGWLGLPQVFVGVPQANPWRQERKSVVDIVRERPPVGVQIAVEFGNLLWVRLLGVSGTIAVMCAGFLSEDARGHALLAVSMWLCAVPILFCTAALLQLIC